MIYKMTLKDSADEMTFELLEVPIVDKDIEGAVDNVTLDGNQYTDYLWLKKQFIQKWSILCDDEYTRLRGFYTRQFENADVPSYRLYYGDDIVRNFTESGENIQFSIEGVADGIMSLTQIDGNTEQNGTPTPSTPVPVETVTGWQAVMVSGQSYEVELYENILDVTDVETGFYINSTGSTVANPNWSTTDYIAVDANTEYIIDGFLITANAPKTAYYNSSKTFIGFIDHTIGKTELTTPADTAYVRIGLYNYVSGGGVQVYESQTAKFYAKSSVIELCKIGTYQDRIYKENGKWWLHKEIGKIAFTSSTAWAKHSTTNGNVFMLNDTGFIGYAYNTGNVAPALMDTDVAVALGSRPDSANGVFGINNVGAQLRVFRGTYDASYTVDTFKAEMVGHYIYGALIAPTTTEITNEALVEELEALVDEAISVGQHNIYTDTPNAIPTLTFDLTEYLSKSTTIIPETAVRLTLTDGGVINACGCRKDVQLTMRETIE